MARRPPFEEWEHLLDYALSGHRQAIAFCLDLFAISQTWDDIVDGDRSPTEEELYASFWKAMVDVPRNLFYQEHFTTLSPMVQAALQDWMDANDLEHGNDNQKAAAYVLRDSVTRIVITCARIIGGYEWMREVSHVVSYALYDESVDQFKEEHDGTRQSAES